MRGKSSKVIETERWVDEYIEKHGYPPTYEEVGKQFGLVSRGSSYQRCRKFRDKMGQKSGKTSIGKEGYTEEQVIGFAEWIDENSTSIIAQRGDTGEAAWDYNDELLTTKQLFQKYLASLPTRTEVNSATHFNQ